MHTAGIGEQAGSVLLSQWNEFCRLRTAVLGRCGTDDIHDLRVVSRRLRATLGLFAPFISAKSAKILSGEIRRVTRELGRVRNIDEAGIYFNSLPASLPVLTKRLRKIRQKEITAVIKALKRVSCRDMGALLRKAAAGLTGSAADNSIDQSLPAYLSNTSIQRYQVLHDLLAAAPIAENRALRHRLRIAIKKWRYLLESVGQVCCQDYASTLELLKEYQTVLGRLNDMVEFSALSDALRLPHEEREAIKTALEQDSERNLALFIELAASRPIQYTFLL
ncbi:MAG: CHAD domain-containing protein [Geobacteraceae bacterium]|nr:CHAD domain-containing protein [Geobacteraceae bacterium]